MSEVPQSTSNGMQEQSHSRQDVDVLLDVQQLKVDRIGLTVRDVRAHVSVAELASLVSLQVGVDARLVSWVALGYTSILSFLLRAIGKIVAG